MTLCALLYILNFCSILNFVALNFVTNFICSKVFNLNILKIKKTDKNDADKRYYILSASDRAFIYYLQCSQWLFKTHYVIPILQMRKLRLREAT